MGSASLPALFVINFAFRSCTALSIWNAWAFLISYHATLAKCTPETHIVHRWDEQSVYAYTRLDLNMLDSKAQTVGHWSLVPLSPNSRFQLAACSCGAPFLFLLFHPVRNWSTLHSTLLFHPVQNWSTQCTLLFHPVLKWRTLQYILLLHPVQNWSTQCILLFYPVQNWRTLQCILLFIPYITGARCTTSYFFHPVHNWSTQIRKCILLTQYFLLFHPVHNWSTLHILTFFILYMTGANCNTLLWCAFFLTFQTPYNLERTEIGCWGEPFSPLFMTLCRFGAHRNKMLCCALFPLLFMTLCKFGSH